MTRGKLLVMATLTGLCVLAPVTASALQATITPDSHWPGDSPLIVSAYQRTADGNDMQLVEVFNVSDTLVDVSKWQLGITYEGLLAGTSKSEMLTSDIAQRGGLSGKLAPKDHAIIELATGTVVTNASYVSDGFMRPAWLSDSKTTPLKGQLTQLSLIPTDTAIERDTYTLKTSSVKINNATTTVYDELWRRTPQSDTGYLSSFFATTISDGGLYNDGLYVSPELPRSRIAEVYHHSETCGAGDQRTECGDYIKVRVATGDETDKLVVRTDNSSSYRTSTNTFALAGRTVSPEGYMTIMYSDTDARLDLTDSGGSIWIEELYGNEPYVETKVHYDVFTEANKNWAYIFDDLRTGQWTTSPQPSLPNKLTLPVVTVAVPTCPAGKYLNPDTNRCRTIEEAVNALAACPEGQERNPTTNRCRSKVLAASTTLTPCGEGQERNPATNRCRSIATAVAELLPCDEGYERNPATNRCRKVVAVTASNESTTAKLVEQAKGDNWDMWTWALVAVGATGAIGYGIYEWRDELLGFSRKIAGRFSKK